MNNIVVDIRFVHASGVREEYAQEVVACGAESTLKEIGMETQVVTPP